MNVKAFIQLHAVSTYFGLALLISYGSFLVLVGPKLLRGGGEQATDAFLLFPIIVGGVCLVGIALTAIVDGRHGLRDLLARVGRWRVGALFSRLCCDCDGRATTYRLDLLQHRQRLARTVDACQLDGISGHA